MSRPRVYLSGPITKGDRSHNVCQFMQAHKILMEKGWAVYNPGLTALLPWAWDVPHAEWIASDLPWVAKADLVVRLPGESVGADLEVACATEHKIPVAILESFDEWDRVPSARYFPTN